MSKFINELKEFCDLHIPYLLDKGICFEVNISYHYFGEYYINFTNFKNCGDVSDDFIPFIKTIETRYNLQNTIIIQNKIGESIQNSISNIESIVIDDNIDVLTIWIMR